MLQHVSLEVRAADAERCVAFWELLGFQRVAHPGGIEARSTWVERKGTQIHLLHRDHPQIPSDGHAAVVAPDYDATLESLRANGFKPDPRAEHWGAPRCFVRDPVGHRVEVMAAPPS